MEISNQNLKKSPKEIKEAIYKASSNHAVTMKQLAKELAFAHLYKTTEKIIEFEEFKSDILDQAADL